MKNVFIPVLAFTFSALAAQADLVLKQKMESPAMTGEMTMSIKGDLIRTDMGKDTTSIMNTTTGDTTTLMHAQKMAMKTSGAQMKAAMAAAKPAAGAPTPKPVATGKTEKVGEYDCEIYTMEMAGGKSTLWIAKDFPHWDKMKTDMAALAKMAGGAVDASTFPGMSVKTIAEAAGVKTTITLLSAKSEPLEASFFVAPTGYQKIGQ
jgi:Domain of unknown function (DUF4412)